MKIFLLAAACLFIAAPPAYARAQYKVRVMNPGNREGKLYIGWHNNAESFMKPRKTTLAKAIEVKDPNGVTVGFDEVPGGTYAISTFPDENGNADPGLSRVGKPKEKYGSSNNVTPAMRPADFKEAAFTVNGENRTLTILLK